MDRPKIQKKSVAIEVRNNFMGVVINTTAYHLGRYSLRLLLLHEELHGTTVSFRLRKFCIIWAVLWLSWQSGQISAVRFQQAAFFLATVLKRRK